MGLPSSWPKWAVHFFFLFICVRHAGAAIFARSVLSFEQGTDQFQFYRYDDPGSALGVSPRVTDVFGGVHFTGPFNNPWQRKDVVSVGLGGYLTLELEQSVKVESGVKALGIFTFQQFLLQGGWGTDAKPTLFYPSMQARVYVSEKGRDWVGVNEGDLISFDIPANGFNGDGSDADYGKPHDLTVGELGGLPKAEIIARYDGSAGGTWLDLSGTGLDRVGYVRFEVDADQAFSFQLEGVSINSDLAGDRAGELVLGDASGDGVFDGLDLAIVKRHMGQLHTRGDVDFDGVTDLGDLFIMRNLSKPGGGSQGGSIPEPSSLALGLALLGGLGCGRGWFW